MPPSGVFSARSRTPALQPASQTRFENTPTSSKDRFRTSQPPDGVLGVPTISPFWPRHSAAPSAVQPVRAAPLKTKSGRNVGPAAAYAVSPTATQSAVTTNGRFDIPPPVPDVNFEWRDRQPAGDRCLGRHMKTVEKS